VVRLVLIWLALLLASASARADESKKADWLAQKQVKAERKSRARHAARRPTRGRAEAVITLRNAWTRELLPVLPGRPPSAAAVNGFLRCHFTNQHRDMDRRLLGLLVAAAKRFRAQTIEILSGYRSPKYNLMLRKKGHQVARESQHTTGHAVDFRIPAVPTRQLLAWVQGRHLGGVGYYPRSRFVHADTGPVRQWHGD
jgi:hypothetical protein